MELKSFSLNEMTTWLLTVQVGSIVTRIWESEAVLDEVVLVASLESSCWDLDPHFPGHPLGQQIAPFAFVAQGWCKTSVGLPLVDQPDWNWFLDWALPAGLWEVRQEMGCNSLEDIQ